VQPAGIGAGMILCEGKVLDFEFKPLRG